MLGIWLHGDVSSGTRGIVAAGVPPWIAVRMPDNGQPLHQIIDLAKAAKRNGPMKEGWMSSVSSASSSNTAYYASQRNLFSKLDADENGKLSKDEFVAGRPKDVSEEQASQLYSKIDSSSTGAVTEDEFAEGMEDSRPGLGIEAQLSGDAMAVLMQLSQQGGMMSSGGGMGAPPSASDIYAEIDADGDGSVTKAEFISGRPDEMTEEDAEALYATIDTESTGSITEEQFADSLPSAGGPPPGGMPPGGGAESTEEIYDALDTNKDGTVSQEEFLAARPDDVTEEQATALFDSIDTENTGSITEEQFSEFIEASASRPMGSPPGGPAGLTDADSILALLDTSAETSTTSV
jgi:Ca2+-binding EF-hand superfamily protein